MSVINQAIKSATQHEKARIIGSLIQIAFQQEGKEREAIINALNIFMLSEKKDD